MLNEHDKTLYSLGAIQQELDRLNAQSAQGRPTADNRAARGAARALPPPRRQPEVSLNPASELPTAVDSLQVRVEYDDTVLPFDIKSDILLEDFKAQVHAALALEPDDRRRMRMGHSTPEGWLFLHSDAVWTAALRANTRRFQLRLATGSSSSGSASSANTVSSAAQPHRLSFEMEGRLQAQKQWEYETKLRTHIKDRVAAKLANDGDTVGASDVTTSVASLRTLLKVCSQLSDEWTMLSSEQQARDDGISNQQLLTWFIAAVINKFHPTIAQVWQSNDPTTCAKRLPTAFESFDVFLAHLYLTVKPGVSGAPSMVLPAMLADLQGRWRSIASRREICGEIRQVLVAVQFLHDHLFTGSSADLTMTVKVFLEGSLADDVQTELMSVLKQYHSDDLTLIFRESDDFAQIQAYQLESVLRRWSALDSKYGKVQPTEFKGSGPGPQPGGGSGGGGGRGPGTSPTPRNMMGGSPVATPPPPSAKEFHITVDGQPITFRQNLASWPDQQDRLREEAKFLKVVYQFDGTCHGCGLFGHRQVGCPERFKLDQNGQDLNPKSYFYTLIPPPTALAARKGLSSGRGSSGSRGGGRGGRGSGRAALAAVLEATERLETKMELMNREQQRDHARVEQVAQQLGQQLGNDLAGAAQ